MKCRVCKKEIKGNPAIVQRLDVTSGDTESIPMHYTCFLLKYSEFKEKLERGDLVDFSQRSDEVEDPELNLTVSEVRKREERAEKSRLESIKIQGDAEKEKEGTTWLCMVNDPAHYYAVRNIIALKGIDMTVDQFEELSALFLVLANRSRFRALQQRSAHEFPQGKK